MKSLAKVLLALALLASCSNSSNSPSEDSSLTDINPQFMVTPDEVYEWHQTKDAGGGTYSGSPSWRAYLAFLEDRMQSYGVVGITRNAWRYNRWYTSDFPGNGDWTLTSDGDAIPVASYSAYSGSTGPEGIAAEMIYYDPASPPAPELLSGKIVVFRTSPHPDPPYSLLYTLFYTFTDYEYTSNPETFGPLYEPVPIDENVNADVWYQLGQTFSFNLEQTDYLSILRESQAIGGLIVFDQSFDRLAGLYQFGVPTLHQCPTLFLDRNAGNQVVEDAIQGRNATLKLTATVEEAETYQLIGYLPGRHYGTPEDEQILLVSHTDGPSISQDNGAFGLLGIVQYFSHIPQSQRPRTLFIFLDNRHYMPGMEAEFASQDWFAQHPEADDLIVASVATEHLGQLEYREIGDVYEPTGRVESSFLWVRNNQLLIDLAIEAVQANGWPRVQVKCTERLGLHDGPQGAMYGLGGFAWRNDKPGYGTMGAQGAYWSTEARIQAFDGNLFCQQVATMAQLTGELMIADLTAVDSVWGFLHDAIANLSNESFSDPDNSSNARMALLDEHARIVSLIQNADYDNAIAALENSLREEVLARVSEGTERESILEMIDQAIQRTTMLRPGA